MKIIRLFLSVLLACVLLLTPGCVSRGPQAEAQEFHIVATTYPLYVLACAVSCGVEGTRVDRLSTGQVSCLHDYTLTVSDMRQLETADLLLLNGAGLEDFMLHATDHLRTLQIDCSKGISLLEADGHTHHEHSVQHDHEHDHEHDPHYWMDPRNLSLATLTIADALSRADPAREALYQKNAAAAVDILSVSYTQWKNELMDIQHPHLITFHDGFHYFAEAFGLHLLFSMEEEEGATASAKDILTAAAYVKEYSVPCIFAETNGPKAAARAVSGETGATVSSLSMLMDGENISPNCSVADALARLLIPMSKNIATLSEVLA